jgi:ABC-2 type transport system permease protein
MKVFLQTVAAPAATALLFLAIFALALGGAVRQVAGVPFLEFLAPGLIMMSMVQNAFANTSSTVIVAKMQGTVIDLVMPPLSPTELQLGLIAGAVTRALLIGLLLPLLMLPFVDLEIAHLGFLVFHAVAASMALALAGLMTGIWAAKFDHVATIQNFVVMPLAFLSGTFYSVQQLPPVFYTVSQFNPFFYMIDGFRYGFLGRADGTPWVGLVVMAGLTALLWIACHRMIASGYKIKA